MESRVKFCLYKIIHSEVQDFDITEIDGIVVNYVNSILEDLSDEQDPGDAFDLESFREMLEAYLPQAAAVKDIVLSETVVNLVKQFRDEKDAKNTPGLDIKQLIEGTTKTNPTRKSRSVSETSSNGQEEKGKRRGGRLEESNEADACGVDDGLRVLEEGIEEGLKVLLEMFPACFQIEAVHCLSVSGGDLERAVQLLMTRAETGQDIKPNQMLTNLAKPAAMDDTQVKKKIMNEYGFVDKEEDARYHRPNIKKKPEDKKMIRYRDGKIVSTKGERFTQVTKEESLEMKRTIKI